MKKAGLVAAARGGWKLTTEGQEYLDAHRMDLVPLPPLSEAAAIAAEGEQRR